MKLPLSKQHALTKSAEIIEATASSTTRSTDPSARLTSATHTYLGGRATLIDGMRSSILIALVAATGCGRIGFTGGTPTDANGDARSDGAIDGVPRPCPDPAWCAEISGVGDDLASIWGASPHELWAVGGGGAIVRRTAAGWGPVESDTGTNLRAIMGSSAQDVWALGEGIGTHWDGTTWTQRASPNTPVAAIWVLASDDVWAVGTELSHWTGTGWATIPTPTPAITMRAIWGASATNVFAVGDSGTILRWNGSVWTQMISNTTRGLYGIHGRAANDIWVTGGFGTLLHFDGATWTSVASPLPQELYSVTVVAPDDAWVAGGSGTVLHWNGAAWSVAASGTTMSLSNIWAHSATELWVVGAVGTIQRGP